MHKKLGLFGSICAALGGILMIVAAFMEDTLPKPLWFVVAACQLVTAITIFNSSRYPRKQNKQNEVKDAP